MNKIVRLSWANIKKHKLESIALMILVMLCMMLCASALGGIIGLKNIFPNMMKNTGSYENYVLINEKDFARCIEKTAEQAKELRAEEIVVGYPKNMNGTVGERAEKCQLFAQELEKLTGCPVKLWDERCTTVSAHGYLNVTNTRGKKRKAVVDAVAAVLILESYLGYRKNSGLSAT